jgi:hypothetical protein
MNQILPISTSQASTRSRYPGTRPFSESPEDRQRFFGRQREGQQLYLRVLSVPLLVQFAKSGLGKTSLLQASLFPRLREKPFLPVMVRFNEMNESPVHAVARSIRQACETEHLQVPEFRTDGLWELLSTALVWRGDLLLTPVLVLDQFEEVFTLRDRTFRDALAVELGALATRVPPERTGLGQASESEPPPAPPDVKILISLREDYLGALEEFSPAIPNLFHERLRLGPLSEQGAREAVTNPAQLVAQDGDEPFWAPPFEFEEFALNEMIAFLKGEAGVIEPFTLQLLCRRAESIARDKGRKSKSPVVLTLADFKDGRDFGQVLKNFYQEAMERLEHRLGRAARDNVEELCEHGLLDREQGRRLLLEERQIHDQFEVDERALNVLVHERLVRRERRQESTFYEISHDRLAESIYASRRNKCSKKEREQRRKEEQFIKNTYRFIITAVTGVLIAILTTSSYFIVTDRATDIATRLSVAEDEGTPLRVRLLSLVDASRKSESAGIRTALKFMFGPHAKEANQALREILARTPIFGGTAQAALDLDGGRLAYLSFSANSAAGKVVTVELPKALSGVSELSLVHASSAAKPIDVQLDKVAGASFARPTIGFIVPAGHEGDALAETMIISPGVRMAEQGTIAPCKDSWSAESSQKDAPDDANRNSLLLVSRDGSARALDLRLGGFGRGVQFPLQVDFGNNSFRVTSMARSGGLPSSLCLLSFQAAQSDEATQIVKDAIGPNPAPDISLRAQDGFPTQLDWDPKQQQAPRIPVLASDCDKFAFLSFPSASEGARFIHPILYAGDFRGRASSTEINFNFLPGSNAPSAVAISRGCTAAIVRMSQNFDAAAAKPNAGDKLFVVNFDLDGGSGKLGSTSEYEIPTSLRGLLAPSWPLLSPALAGAHLPGSNAMRVAWLTENGLAVVDLQEGSNSTPMLSSEGQVFLTGFANAQGNTRMTISRNGDFLLMVSQRSFAMPPEFRIYDLRTEKRQALLAKLDGAQLRQLACQVLSFMHPSSLSDDAAALLRGASLCDQS